MRTHLVLLLAAGFCVQTSLRADTPVRSAIAKQGANAVLTWETVPGKSYILKGSTNLAQWQRLPPAPAALVATSNQLSHLEALTHRSSFYTVAKLDTEGPFITPL